MPKKPPKSKERIIPIQMETDDDPIQEPEPQKDEKESAELSSSEEQAVMDAEEPCKEAQPKKPVSPCPIDTWTSLEDSEVIFQDENSMKRTLPVSNVPEKIVLVVDGADDENYTPFCLKNGQASTPLDVLKRAVEVFLYNKQLISKKHEYALVALNVNEVIWLQNFTRNIKDVINALQQIESCKTEDVFQLNPLFDLIIQKTSVPNLLEVENLILPPNYVVRTILLYGRSYTMPKLVETDEISNLLESPYFTLDVLMTHEPVDNNNNCNKIFSVLQNLDRKGFSYFFPVARNARTLFGSMGKLLGHPLQRAPQQFANYSIK